MQITTWNCCRGKPEVKLPHLLQIEPDIVTIQEAAKPANLLGKTQAWYGDNPNQGLLSLTYHDLHLEPVKRSRTTAKFFQPMRITGAAKFNLLHVWVKPLLGAGRYMDALLRGIAAYRNFIQSDRTVVLGDLNSAAYWGQRHLDFVDMMRKEFNLVSAYHEYFDLKHGDETHFTYFDRTQHGRPYHIDYCFIPKSWLKRLNKVEVGAPIVWTRLSDHVPLTIELIK